MMKTSFDISKVKINIKREIDYKISCEQVKIYHENVPGRVFLMDVMFYL